MPVDSLQLSLLNETGFTLGHAPPPPKHTYHSHNNRLRVRGMQMARAHLCGMSWHKHQVCLFRSGVPTNMQTLCMCAWCVSVNSS